MWFSPLVGATGRLVRLAYRTPFGVDKPTIWGRATAARTARDVCSHSTIWQYGRVKVNGCLPPCRLPLRPTRVVLPTRRRKFSLLEAGGSASKDAEICRKPSIRSSLGPGPVVGRDRSRGSSPGHLPRCVPAPGTAWPRRSFRAESASSRGQHGRGPCASPD